MADEQSPTGNALIPDDRDRRLFLPSRLVKRGLELAIWIERKQDIEKYDRPVLKFPGLLSRSCVSFSRNGEFAAITSHGRQGDNPGLVIWHVVSRILSVFPEAGFRRAAPARFFVERIPSDEEMGVTKESAPISEIMISATETRYKPIGHPDSTPRDIYSVALSRRGDLSLIGYGDGSICRCSIADHVIRDFSVIAGDSHGHKVTAIAISPDDQYFAECTGFYVCIRDTASGKEIKRFQGRNSYYNQLAFSDDGSKLLIASGRQTSFRGIWGTFMTLLDVGGKQPPVLFGGNRIMQVTAVSVFPDNQRILSLDDEGIITVWNAKNGDEISHWKHTESDVGDVIQEQRLAGNLKTVMKNPRIWGLSSVAVSSDGRRVLSGGADNHMRLWTATGHRLWEYPHDSRVVKVAFSPDGRHALSGCWDGSVCLWELP